MIDKIASELISRSAADQAMRNQVIESGNMSLWDDKIDKINAEYLKKIIDEVGWPTISMAGDEASQAAWLIVQHADHDVGFQAYCLKLLKSLPATEVRAVNVAYLEDRVLVARGRPQLYGTQFYKKGDKLRPYSIKGLNQLEARRSAVGLEAFDVYWQKILEQYDELP